MSFTNPPSVPGPYAPHPLPSHSLIKSQRDAVQRHPPLAKMDPIHFSSAMEQIRLVIGHIREMKINVMNIRAATAANEEHVLEAMMQLAIRCGPNPPTAVQISDVIYHLALAGGLEV